MKKILILVILLVLISKISWATKIAIIDGFQPTIVYGAGGEEYKLSHGEEVANIIKTIHEDAEIIKLDYMVESAKRFKLSMDLKAWQGCCESTIAEYIVKAVDEGAKIINISLKAHLDSQVLKDAVDYAWNKGVIVCWAAGNEEGKMAFFPAPDKYVEWFPNALIVGATDYEGNISNFSHTAELYAWGEKINYGVLRTWRLYLGGFLKASVFNSLLKHTFESVKLTPFGFPTDLLSGTSFSTPIITGLLAEILEYKDFDNPQETIDYLMSYTKENAEGRKILFLEDLILMYKDFGFDIDSPGISFIPVLEPMQYKPNLPIPF